MKHPDPLRRSAVLLALLALAIVAAFGVAVACGERGKEQEVRR